MSENSIEQKTQEQALLQALVQELEEAKKQGLPLPASVQPPGQPAEQQTQTTIVTPVTVSQEDTVMTPVAESKKRKAEDYPKQSGGEDIIPVGEQLSPAAEKPVEPETKVAKKVVPQAPAKVTPGKIATMTVEDVLKLDASQLQEGIEMSHLIQAKVPRPVRDAIRPLIDPSVKKQQEDLEEAKKQRGGDLEAFNKVRNTVKLTGSWNKHYQGTEKGDDRFTAFLKKKEWSTKHLIETVVTSAKLAGGQHCQFMDPPRSHQICKVQIDLSGFFNDSLLKDMTIAAAVTDEYLEVFHAGPRD